MTTPRAFCTSLAVIPLIALFAGCSRAKDGYCVHDMARPQPQKITPATSGTDTRLPAAPSDAIVLFDGKDLSAWQTAKGAPAPWKLADGYFQVAPGTGSIQSKQQFGDCQLHVEWREPKDVQGQGQGRGNSGVFVQGLYEIQVLDSSGTQTYPDGMAGAIYGQYPPLVNATRPPGQWNTYDAIFHAAKTDTAGHLTVTSRARMTVLFNGILVQDNMSLLGPTVHNLLASYPAGVPAKGPLVLQDHGNPVEYRNIWIRPLHEPVPPPPVRPHESN